MPDSSEHPAASRARANPPPSSQEDDAKAHSGIASLSSTVTQILATNAARATTVVDRPGGSTSVVPLGVKPPGAAGTMLGPVRVCEQIGEGGMGVVFRGRHTLMDVDVAVKVLPASRFTDQNAKDVFLEGVRAGAAVTHPGLNRILHADLTPDGSPFIVMDFVRGCSLADVLRRRERFAVGEAVDIACRIAEAVGALHTAGIIHRDIKPANVLIDEQGRVQVTDFGLAVAGEIGPAGTTRAGIAGTPLYMAPEAFEGEVSPRTDVYALGITLFELIAGLPPFSGSVAELREAHRLLAIPFDHVECLGAPTAAVQVIRRSTAKRPLQRYRDATVLASDLSTVPVRDVPAGTSEAPTLGRKRHSLGVGGGDELRDGRYYDRISGLARVRSSGRSADTAVPHPEPSPMEAPLALRFCSMCWYELGAVPTAKKCPECGVSTEPGSFSVSHQRSPAPRWTRVLLCVPAFEVLLPAAILGLWYSIVSLVASRQMALAYPWLVAGIAADILLLSFAIGWLLYLLTSPVRGVPNPVATRISNEWDGKNPTGSEPDLTLVFDPDRIRWRQGRLRGSTPYGRLRRGTLVRATKQWFKLELSGRPWSRFSSALSWLVYGRSRFVVHFRATEPAAVAVREFLLPRVRRWSDRI